MDPEAFAFAHARLDTAVAQCPKTLSFYHGSLQGSMAIRSESYPLQREAASFGFKEEIEKFGGFSEQMQDHLNPGEDFLSFFRAANLIV